MITQLRRRLLATTLFIGATCATTPAIAQDEGAAQVPVENVEPAEAETPGEEIVVTGSRIPRADLEASSPVTVISGEALKISGSNSVEEYLREIPQAVAAIGENTNNGNAGVATIDLRNLGEERTLVLVDGRRFVPFDSNGIVDLNMIPAALVVTIRRGPPCRAGERPILSVLF